MKRIAIVFLFLMALLFATAHAEVGVFVPGEKLMMVERDYLQLYFTGGYREITDDPEYPMGAVALEYCFVNLSETKSQYDVQVEHINELDYRIPSVNWDDDPVADVGESCMGELILDASRADVGFDGFDDLESLQICVTVGEYGGDYRVEFDPGCYFSEEAARTAHVAAVNGSETVILSRGGIEVRLNSWELKDDGKLMYYGEIENRNFYPVSLRSSFITLDDDEYTYAEMTVDGKSASDCNAKLPGGKTVSFVLARHYTWSPLTDTRMIFRLQLQNGIYYDIYDDWASGRIMLYESEEARAADTQTIFAPLPVQASGKAETAGLLFTPGEEILIVENEQFVVYLTGEYRDADTDPDCPRGTVALGYRVENRMDHKSEFHYMGYLNGAQMVESFTSMGKAIAPGESREGEFVVKSADLGVYFETFADLKTLSVEIAPFYEDCYDMSVGSKTVLFSEAELHTANLAAVQGEENVIVDENGVKVLLESWYTVGEYVLLQCEMQNNSPEDVCFDCRVSVNGRWGYVYSDGIVLTPSEAKSKHLICVNMREEIGGIDNIDPELEFWKNAYKGEKYYNINDINLDPYFTANIGRIKLYASEADRAADTQTQFVPVEEDKGPYVDAMYEYTDKETVRRAQVAMNDLGYECGTPDGVSGKKTKAALSAFQKDHGLAETGVVTYQTAEALEALGYKILGY